MPQELKIKIGSDVGGAISGIKAVNRELAATTGSFNKADAAVQKSTKNFTGLTRVLQDAPFGFIAISNNLEQLIPAAGGAGLAFSALISIVSFAQIGFANWTRGIGDNEDALKDHLKAIKEQREALDNYVAVLNDLNQARVKGDQNAQEELVSLETLYKATQNQNISLSDRKKLVDQLQEQYPKYFANIKDEIILAGGAAKAYSSLRDAIVASARARALQDTLVGKQKDKIVLEQQYSDLVTKTFFAQQKLQQQEAKSKELREKGAGVRGEDLKLNEQLRYSLAEEFKLRNNYNSALDEAKNKMKEINVLQNQSAVLAQQTQNIVEKNPNALLNPTGNIDKQLKKTKKEIEKFHFAFPIEPTVRNAPALAKEVGKAFSDLHVKAAINMDEPTEEMKRFTLDTIDNFDKVRTAGERLGKGLGAVFQEIFSDKLQAAITKGLSVEQLNEFEKKLRETMVVGAELADILGTAFGAFGAALAQGQNAMQAFFSSVKQSLSQLISYLFKTIAVAAILSVITGGAGSAGGMSFLSAFKSLLGVKPFAAGGLVTGPTLGLVGEGRTTNRSNPEVIAPLDKLKKMIGGGQQSQVFIPDLHVGYDEWRISFNRAIKQGGLFS